MLAKEVFCIEFESFILRCSLWIDLSRCGNEKMFCRTKELYSTAWRSRVVEKLVARDAACISASLRQEGESVVA